MLYTVGTMEAEEHRRGRGAGAGTGRKAGRTVRGRSEASVRSLISGHVRNSLDPAKFNRDAVLPYSLRLMDFEIAMQGELGTRTATLRRGGVRKLREHWIYKA